MTTQDGVSGDRQLRDTLISPQTSLRAASLPSPVTLWKHPPRNAQRCVSWVILNPITLAIEASHHQRSEITLEHGHKANRINNKYTNKMLVYESRVDGVR